MGQILGAERRRWRREELIIRVNHRNAEREGSVKYKVLKVIV